MKNFVLTLFAMFVLASLFLGCGRGMKMLKSMGDERIAENKESTPEPPPPGEHEFATEEDREQWILDMEVPITEYELPPPPLQTSISSNPLFADGVPEHLQCPPEFITLYRREAEENFRQKVPWSIYEEIKEKWNPNRPLTEVWPAFIEQEQWYRENAEPERAENFGAAGRLGWLVQHWLDYPEITVLLDEDAPRASDMLEALGLWNLKLNPYTAEQNSVSTEAGNADDASALEQIENAAFMNVGISGAFVPEYDIAAAAGAEFGWFYETPRYAIGTEFRLNISDNYDAVFFSIGSRYFFTEQNISSYVGGGCAIGGFSISSSRSVLSFRI